MHLSSFDIFDTCLMRKCGDAENVFWLLARQLFPKDSIKQQTFYNWRCGAESFAKQKLDKATVSINDIYRFYPYAKVAEVVGWEMDLEKELLSAIPSTLNLLKQEREKGKTIAFISDMYMPSDFLKEILQREGFWEEGDYIYVSCEYNATKSSCQLYGIVEKELHPEIWHHYGDNKYSDVKMANKSGVKSILINSWWTKAELFLIERIKNQKEYRHLSTLIGLVRYTRLKNGDTAYSDLSSFMVAIVYIAYIVDALQVANDQGYERLYFLARDGYILKYVADFFHARYPNIDLRYLYVSRKAMFLPSIHSLGENELEEYFGDGYKYQQTRKIVDYFQLEKLLLTSLPEGSLYDSEIRNSVFNQLNDKKQKKIILDAVKERRKLILKYFQQEGILDDLNYALVDVGWKGSSRIAFNKLLQVDGCSSKPFFYYGTFKEYRKSFCGEFYTYNLHQQLPVYMITLVEDYFSCSPDLSTIGYKEENGRVKPVFNDKSRIDNSEILSANKAVIKDIAPEVLKFELDDGYLLDLLASEISNIINNHADKLNLSALVLMNCFSETEHNKKGLIHKFSLLESFKYIIGLNIKTSWEDACCYYTFGRIGKLLMYLRRSERFLLKGAKRIINY